MNKDKLRLVHDLLKNQTMSTISFCHRLLTVDARTGEALPEADAYRGLLIDLEAAEDYVNSAMEFCEDWMHEEDDE